MPLIIPSNSITGGYEVANSLRFDRASSDYLSKTYGSAGNRKTMTFSFWIKRSNLSTNQYPMSIYDSGSGNQADMRFAATTDVFRMYATGTDATPRVHLVTDRVFRDTSAWYHMVWEIDTTQATESDRVKLYVNGVQETSFSTETYPAQNTDLRWNGTSGSTGGVTNIGAINGGNSIDGYMAEVCFIDGTALDPTSFGEFDEDTGIWKPIDVSGLTFGTNGFYLDFEDSAALGDDVSGNGNDFTVNNLTSIDQTTDTPTNNYATINPLNSSETSATNFFTSLGNTELTATDNDSTRQMGITLNPENMKGYFEMKVAVDNNWQIHVQDITRRLTKTPYDNSSNPTYSYYDAGNIRYGNGTNWTNLITSYTSASSTGDIIGVAFDFTGSNKNVWFSLNGTYGNNGSGVGNPATGDYPALTATNLNTADHYAFLFSVNTGGADSSVQANFGNPPFTISSGNSDANGYGNFEYAVPSGYYALNTKNLAEYG